MLLYFYCVNPFFAFNFIVPGNGLHISTDYSCVMGTETLHKNE